MLHFNDALGSLSEENVACNCKLRRYNPNFSEKTELLMILRDNCYINLTLSLKKKKKERCYTAFNAKMKLGQSLQRVRLHATPLK